MQKCELLALRKKDFTYKIFLFFYIPSKVYVKSSKTGRTRIIYLDLKISLYMTFYSKNLDLEDSLFTFSSHYVSNNFNKVFKSSNNKNKIKQIRFADIRHIHASYLLANSKNKANCIKNGTREVTDILIYNKLLILILTFYNKIKSMELNV